MSSYSPRSAGMSCIALIAADPFSTDPARLDEHAEIVRSVVKSESEWEVVPVFEQGREAVSTVLKQLRPSHVEFSGYGSASGRVLLVNDSGEITNPTGRTLVKLLPQESERPDVLVLNGCALHRGQAELALAARFAVRVSGGEVEETELRFAQIFYGALARGVSVPEILGGDLLGRAETRLSEYIDVQLLAPPEARPDQPRGVVAAEFTLVRGDQSDERQESRGRRREPRRDGGFLYTVWYGTNRAPKNKRNLSEGFSQKRALDAEGLALGACTVVIPPSRRTGTVGSPRWQIWRRDRLRIESRRPLSEDEFCTELTQALETVEDRRCVMCYVHGYNVTFDEAAIRAAQMGFDLKVQGETALFSWPSRGHWLGYPADEASVEACEGALVKFLGILGERSGARAVHIIAHSMGNRAVLRALSRMVSRPGARLAAQFDQILLAAPDVDADVFRQLVRVFPAVSRRTTLYACPHDQALRASSSRFLHGYHRAGLTPPITLVDLIDTVEVQTGGLGLLGHSYYGESWPVLADINSLLNHDRDPSLRLGLRETVDAATGMSYWVLA
jgi:esterase/lipase superfamily enzyme